MMNQCQQCQSVGPKDLILYIRSSNNDLITLWSLLLLIYLTVTWGQGGRGFCFFPLNPPPSHDSFYPGKKLDFVPTEGPRSEIRVWTGSLQGRVSLTILLKNKQGQGKSNLVYCQDTTKADSKKEVYKYWGWGTS